MRGVINIDLTLLFRLKTFQNLGYFIAFDEVPDEIINHIRKKQSFTTGKATDMSVLRMIITSRYTHIETGFAFTLMSQNGISKKSMAVGKILCTR